MLLAPRVVLGVHSEYWPFAFTRALSQRLCVAPASLYVLEYYGGKVRVFSFVSYPVNGSWTVLLTVKPHFQFRVGRRDVHAVLSEPELHPIVNIKESCDSPIPSDQIFSCLYNFILY